MPYRPGFIISALLAAALPGAGGAASAQDGGPGPAVYEVAAPVTVDGALTEWTTPSFAIPFRSDQPGDEPAARARLAFDDRYLYLALEVPDDTLAFPERSWRFGDGFYLTVLMPATGEASASHVSLGFSRVGDRLEGVVVNRSGEYFPAVDMTGVRLAMSPDPEALPAPDGGPVAWRGDVVYEAAVPWSLLAPANPVTEDSLTLNIVTVDRDGGRDRRFGMLVEDPGFDTERTPVRRGRPVPLVRRAKSPEAAIAARLPRPVIATDDGVDVIVGYRPGDTPGEAGVHAGLRVELVQEDAVVAAADVVPAGRDVLRATVRLLPGPGAVTGPATVRVRAPDAGTSTDVFLADRGRLETLGRELDRIERDPAVPHPVRASVPTAAVRLAWLLEFVDGGAANAPLDGPRTWWRELSSLNDGLRRGTAAVPRTPGAHRVAHRSTIDGSLQPYTVHLPDGYDPEGGRYPVLVALHGSGVDEQGTARAAGRAAAHGWVVVAPRGRGLSDWYVDDAETDVLEALDHAVGTLAVDPERVHLAGFSMGGYGSWRLALRHGHRFRAAAVLAGAPCAPASAGGECVADFVDEVRGPVPPLLVVHGAQDQAVPIDGVRSLVQRARRHMDLEYREIPDVGHGTPGWWPLALEWLGR